MNRDNRILQILITLFIVIPASGTPVTAQWTMGARNIAMGQAYTALPSDTWAIFHNPAMMDSSERRFSVFAIRYYGLKELEDHAAVISLPLSKLSESYNMIVSGGVHSYGYSLYRETRLLAGGAIRARPLRAGLTLRYNHLRISGYGSSGSMLFDAGLALEVAEGITLGYRWLNIFQDGFPPGGNDPDETPLYPTEMATGLSWRFAQGLLISTEILKDALHPFTIRSGLEVEVYPKVYIRGGWTSRPFTWSAGTGLQISAIIVSIAVQKHEVLGLSPGFNCTFTF